MAAIIEPHRLPLRPAPRPALRLVSAHDGRPVGAPVELGFGAFHVAAAVAAIVVVVLLAIGIGGGAFAALAPAPTGPSASPAASSSSAAAATTVTVEAGDSLWTIARKVQPVGDVRPLVDRLSAVYGDAPLRVGQQVSVPA